MKKILPALLLFLLPVFLQAQQKANYELAERFSSENFRKATGMSLSIYPEFINEGDQFWFTFTTEEGKRYYYVDPAKREKSLLFDSGRVLSQISELTRKAYDAKDFSLQKMKFADDRSTFTFEFERNVYRYNRKSERVVKVDTVASTGWGASWKVFSPDSNYIMYAQRHNLYVRGNAAKGKDTTAVQLTFDGEEFFSFAKEEADTFPTEPVAVWMKDSRKIYAVRTDERKVKELWLVKALTDGRPELKTYKYAMPGEQEVGDERLEVIDVESGRSTLIQTEQWPGQHLSVLYADKKGEKIYFERRNRSFNTQELCVADVGTGEVKVLIHEEDKPFMDYLMSNIMFLNDGKDIIYRSERTGWGHLYLYDNEGKYKHTITSGEWVTGPVTSIDTVGREIYFYALGKDPGIDPYYYTLCRVNIDRPGSVVQMTSENATHSVYFPKSHRYFVDIYNRVDLVPRIVLKNRKGEELMELAVPDVRRAKEMGWRVPERFKVKAADGITDLYGVMWKPFDFDSTRNYPVISSVYPGPQYEYVPTQFSLEHGENMRLAQLGFVVVAVGHRGGTPMRGKVYHTYSSGRLRDYPLADDKYAIEQLADRYGFIDRHRVGIFGHSGGGFMSTAAICTYPDFYKAAVSSAGNHDNHIYNRWWGETHHGVKEQTKTVTDTINGERQETTFSFSVPTNIQLAKNYKGGLLLVHGWMDDNVHPAHTLRMVNALIEAGKNVDMIILPEETHGFGGAAQRYYERSMWWHFERHLLKKASSVQCPASSVQTTNHNL